MTRSNKKNRREIGGFFFNVETLQATSLQKTIKSEMLQETSLQNYHLFAGLTLPGG